MTNSDEAIGIMAAMVYASLDRSASPELEPHEFIVYAVNVARNIADHVARTAPAPPGDDVIGTRKNGYVRMLRFYARPGGLPGNDLVWACEACGAYQGGPHHKLCPQPAVVQARMELP